MDVWPWGQAIDVCPGVPVGCKRAGKRQTWMPRRSHWCVALGWRLAAGWSMPSQRFKGFTVLKGLEGFKRLEGLERLEGFKALRAGKRQTWTPRRSQWCVALGKRQTWMPIRSHGCVAFGTSHWCMPWGACWLQEGWQTADLDAHKKPLMCGLGVAVGCRMKHAKSTV